MAVEVDDVFDGSGFAQVEQVMLDFHRLGSQVLRGAAITLRID